MSEMVEVLRRRGLKDLDGHLSLHEAHATKEMPRAGDSDTREAGMPQPKDEMPAHDPMKETGEGYFTEDEHHHPEDSREATLADKGHGVPENYEHGLADYLGSENAGGLRAKALSMALKKNSKGAAKDTKEGHHE